ncbi:MAG: hypothetical protein P8M78_04405 [Myxococcota bacterium]|nr:hypothetical protein [Myxococcota bacterium]
MNANGLALTGSALLCLLISGAGEEGLRAFVRLTAWQATLIFSAVLAGKPLETLIPNGWTRSLHARGRVLLKALAFSMITHLMALCLLALVFPEPFWSTLSSLSLAAGALAYILLGVVTFIPERFAVRELGPRSWRRLRGAALGFLWIVFAQTYLSQVPEEPSAFAFFSLLCLVALLLGVARFRSRPQEIVQ